ncbi:MAG: 23S rRNA pseudouridine(955/2504/2580) synthase RluC [Aestuariibacter sp.]
MSEEIQQKVRFITIEKHQSGQRIDNFLRTFLKGVPKSMIYRILRKGEVRVNKKRIKPEYRLEDQDLVRVPPVRTSAEKPVPSANLDNIKRLESAIIYEDNQLIVLNKPSGMAVHGGSGLSYGVIEGLRALRPDTKFLELVHRLDRDTSGCLLIAKKRSVLKHLHEQLREKETDKRYFALVRGQWPKKRNKVTAPLQKNTLQSGERMVRVSKDGKASETRFNIVREFDRATLVEAIPVTGRTHQIRVHCLHAGHPILGDDKYCDSESNGWAKSKGLTRLFLHAHQIAFNEYGSENELQFKAPLDADLEKVLKELDKDVG